ncbi:ABC transporter ATP-binding protein [Euzebya tangerina]|uniref:ABC transporter ATP-binding protein n=1 Tax=Euzebya tangerina TaxID=591198 RepID=UPI00196BA549|nr:ABC transporter ATP-binding protein [Euzebya tangerina]
MTAAVIRTEGLTKDYGDGRGVFDLELVVHAGEVVGYLGPNGAGKSTTIRMLLDMVRPTRGRAEVLGVPPAEGVSVRRRIGYVPGELALWSGWTGRQILDFLGAMHRGFEPSRIAGLAERFQLDLDRAISDLSKGNKQKVGLVAAFARRHDLLILDEPTSGLDPLLQVEFQHVVAEAVAEGSAVLLSSHVLSEVEHVADRVGIIRRGHLVDVLDVAELRSRSAQEFDVTFAGEAPGRMDDIEGVEVVLRDGPRARYRVSGSMDAFVKALAAHPVEALRGSDADLEQVFLQYYAESGDTPQAEGAAP